MQNLTQASPLPTASSATTSTTASSTIAAPASTPMAQGAAANAAPASAAHSLKFNHLSFPSRDVAATASFFERHLEWQSTPMGRSRVLKGHGFDVVIDDAADQPVEWPNNFHIGFELPSLEALESLYQRFKAADVEFATALFAHERGSRFFCRIPGGVLVELNTREDAAAPFRAGFGRS